MKRFLSALVVLCMLLCFVGCTQNLPVSTAPSTTVPATEPTETETQATEPADAREVYRQLISQFPTDIAMDLSMTWEMEIAGSRFVSTSAQKITYRNRGSEAFTALVEETASFDRHSGTYKEAFVNGTVYADINGQSYFADQTEEEFTARYLPAALLDETLYETVSIEGNTILFSGASALESWLCSDTVAITEASGTVTQTDAGIHTVTYTAAYTVGGAAITVTVNQTFSTADATISAPKNLDAYLETESIDAIKLLDTAYGYLLQAKQFSASTLSSIQSQAAGFVTNNQYHLDTYVTSSGTDYLVESTVYAQDATNKSQQDMTEKFIGGVYTYSVDNGAETSAATVTASVMQDYVQDILLANMVETKFFTGASITDLGSLYLAEFTCSEDLALSICQDFCKTYLGQADILHSLSSKYKTNTMEYYLALDKYTLLPTACGYLYEGCHTIEGYDYLLIEQLDQSFDLASLTSHDAIYESPVPDMEPEKKATPLLYRVTGSDGQQMWLFGTIHVGDDRTAFLPQELYDALLSSDALAVECDTEGFNKAVEEDEALQSQVSDCYFYRDGTVADHLDTEDLHEDAVKAMKATGNYFYNSEYQKAALWSSAIDNYYLQQGHQLLSEKGLEQRLETIAAENNIPLWEVESSLFQIKMLTSYSDYLQEFQLYSSTYSHGKTSWEDTMELYELWCEGNEAKLIEEMKREVWAFTDEDLKETEDMDEEDLADLQYIRDNKDTINAELAKIHQEYVKAMESDRNAGMLEVAKGYLESDDTVFFAVGLAHLLAEDGLVFTLRDAGYTVELVKYKS